MKEMKPREKQELRTNKYSAVMYDQIRNILATTKIQNPFINPMLIQSIQTLKE